MPESSNITDINEFLGVQVVETTEEDNQPVEPVEDSQDVQAQEPTKEQTQNDDFKYPEWLDPELVPTKFDDSDKELDFYRNNYKKLASVYSSQEFIENYANQYEEYLINKDNDVERLRAIKTALNGEGGEIVAKLMFNNALQKAGYNTNISKEEAKEFIDTKLSEVYGSDWENKYNKEDELDPSTLSGKIFRDKHKLIEAFNNHKPNNIPQNTMSEEQALKVIDEEYDKHFKPHNFPRKVYDEFINEIKSTNYQLSAMDIYKAKNFETLVNSAYERGIKEGKENIRKEIEKVSDKTYNGFPPVNYNDYNEKANNNKPFTIDDLYNVNPKGR